MCVKHILWYTKIALGMSGRRLRKSVCPVDGTDSSGATHPHEKFGGRRLRKALEWVRGIPVGDRS